MCIDKKILTLLQQDSKQTNKQISLQMNLSVTAVYERIKKLENNGIIIDYVALIDKKKVEKANFAVLKAIDVCSILVETAFLSNRTEEKELRTSAYQEKLATAILFGIKDFLKTTPPEHLGVKISKH